MTNTPSPITLRAPRPEDIETRRAAGRSAEIARMYGYAGPLDPVMSRAQAEDWFKALSAHPCGFVIDRAGTALGEARLDSIHETDRRARLAIGLFREEDLGRGIGRTAVRLLLSHAFGRLGLHRVDLRVLAFNTRAIRCYEACGFLREGIERQSARVGEDWCDDWIMALLEPEYRAQQAT